MKHLFWHSLNLRGAPLEIPGGGQKISSAWIFFSSQSWLQELFFPCGRCTALDGVMLARIFWEKFPLQEFFLGELSPLTPPGISNGPPLNIYLLHMELTIFDILKFSLEVRRWGHKQWELNDMLIYLLIYLFCLCSLGLSIKLNFNISKVTSLVTAHETT